MMRLVRKLQAGDALVLLGFAAWLNAVMMWKLAAW